MVEYLSLLLLLGFVYLEIVGRDAVLGAHPQAFEIPWVETVPPRLSWIKISESVLKTCCSYCCSLIVEERVVVITVSLLVWEVLRTEFWLLCTTAMWQRSFTNLTLASKVSTLGSLVKSTHNNPNRRGHSGFSFQWRFFKFSNRSSRFVLTLKMGTRLDSVEFKNVTKLTTGIVKWLLMLMLKITKVL